MILKFLANKFLNADMYSFCDELKANLVRVISMGELSKGGIQGCFV